VVGYVLSLYFGPIGGFAGAALARPAEGFLEWLDRREGAPAQAVVAVGALGAGLSLDEVERWVASDPVHGFFLLSAVEAARAARDLHALDGLASLVAEGLQDDARIDVNEMYISAIGPLRAPHVRVLDRMESKGGAIPEGALGYSEDPAADPEHPADEWTRETLVQSFPGLADGLDAIMSQLVSSGLTGLGAPRIGGPSAWRLTAFGRGAVTYLRSGAVSQFPTQEG
jgi:hypothetical protein